MKDKILLKDLIIELKSVIEPWNHSESTKWQYNYSWKTLQEFFEGRVNPILTKGWLLNSSPFGKACMKLVNVKNGNIT